MKAEILYRGKKYTDDDIPPYIHRKMPKHPDKLTAWINILKKKNEWTGNNVERVKVSRKKAYWKNPEENRRLTREWSKNNPDKKKEMDAEYRRDNKTEIAEYMHEYYRDHKAEKQAYDREYRANPDKKERIAELRNNNNRKYSKNNWYVTRHKIQSQLSTLCGKDGKYRKAKYKNIDLNACVDSLISDARSKGYSSIQKIKETHHIDHIIPVSYYSIEEFKKAYHPLNLRWLPAKENMSRQNNITKQDWEIINTLPKEIYPQSIKEIK